MVTKRGYAATLLNLPPGEEYRVPDSMLATIDDADPGYLALEAADRQVEMALVASVARQYILDRIDPDGLFLIDRLVRAGHQYGIECEQWLVSVRMEQYRRMAAIEAGVEVFSEAHLDFSSFGDKPYTVPQMMIAAGM